MCRDDERPRLSGILRSPNAAHPSGPLRFCGARVNPLPIRELGGR